VPAPGGGTLNVTSIDLALLLDDDGPDENQWHGFVIPETSILFPIVHPQEPPDYPRAQGPFVQGQRTVDRACTQEAPCALTSDAFSTPVSSRPVDRWFQLAIDHLDYQDEQTPNAIEGDYREQIENYSLGRAIVVNGHFRAIRAIPIVPLGSIR
jgi:hypothetical protein